MTSQHIQEQNAKNNAITDKPLKHVQLIKPVYKSIENNEIITNQIGKHVYKAKISY